jgi:hypothetical protein
MNEAAKLLMPFSPRWLGVHALHGIYDKHLKSGRELPSDICVGSPLADFDEYPVIVHLD